MRLTAATVVLFSLAAMAGCRRPSVVEDRIREAMQTAERFAALPGLAASHDEVLQGELSRLQTERATPLLLDEDRRREVAESMRRAEVPESLDLAQKLKQVFPKHYLQSLKRKTGQLFMAESPASNPLRLETLARLRATYDVPRRQVRDLIDHPGATLMIPHAKGLLSDLTLADTLRIDGRLEGALALEMLQQQRFDDALEAVHIMLRLVQLQAAQPHLALRLAAAHQRRETFLVIGELANHERTTPEIRRQLAMLLQRQLETWPPDRDAWIGERALGLHAYELVRDGQPLLLFSPDELTRFEEEKSLSMLPVQILAHIDDDQRFYLTAMREVINHCSQPFHKRLAGLQKIEDALVQLRPSTDYPRLAGDVLLVDLVMHHRLQAQDRARCEGWLLALSAANGQPLAEPRISPLTGEPYRVVYSDGRWIVWGADDEPHSVPPGVRGPAGELNR